jgi:hypothetical protein
MKQQFCVKQAERKTLALSFADGLWEILLGGMIVLIGLADTFEASGWPVWMSYLPWLAFTVVGIAVFNLLKQRMVGPRMGFVKIHLIRNKQHLRLFLAAIALQVVTLVILLLGINGSLENVLQDSPEWMMDAFFGLGVLVVFGMMAYATRARRFFLHGALLGLALPLGVMLREPEQATVPHPQVVAGFFMALVGVMVFVKFLQKYPLPAEENQDE